MRLRSRILAAIAAAIWCVQEPILIAQDDQNDAADAARLIQVLRIRPGATVADVGAGSGRLIGRIAHEVGRGGRVYATDVNPQRLVELRQLAQAENNTQTVVVVEGGSSHANLPDGCCDAIFMRHVYHHFGEPAIMNASLYRSLKTGGRIAVVDFAPRSQKSGPAGRRDTDDAHGVMPMTIIDELAAAGFIRVQEVAWSSPGYFLVIGERP